MKKKVTMMNKNTYLNEEHVVAFLDGELDVTGREVKTAPQIKHLHRQRLSIMRSRKHLLVLQVIRVSLFLPKQIEKLLQPSVPSLQRSRSSMHLQHAQAARQSRC
jgi:hypothetical protein